MRKPAGLPAEMKIEQAKSERSITIFIIVQAHAKIVSLVVENLLQNFKIVCDKMRNMLK